MSASWACYAMLVLGLTLTSGCFSMGMPEVIHSPLPASAQAQLVGIVVDEEVISFREAPQSLGEQFVAIIFPVTRLMFAHGVNLYLLEVASEVLQQAGFDPVIVSKRNLPIAQETFRFRHILHPRLTDISVNAYDALFFRILRVSGVLVVDEFQARGFDLRRTTSISIDETAYRTDGHASTLSAMLKRAFSSALQNSLREFPAPLRPTSRIIADSERPLLVIQLLNVPVELLPVAEVIEASYGYPRALGFNERTLARIIQRGMLASTERESIPAVSAPFQSTTLSGVTRPVWVISGHVEEFIVEERLSLGLRLELSSASPGRGPERLLRAHCRGTYEELDNVDGSWVFTLEQAAAQLVKSFLERGKECLVTS